MSNLIGAQTREVRNMQRGPRMIAAQIDGTGTAALLVGSAREVVLTDNDTGDYTLEVSSPFAREPVVVATPVGAAGDVVVTLGTVTASSIQILAWDGTDGTTAKDADIHVMIMGFDAEDEI